MTLSHFEAIREFRNTINVIRSYWSMPRAVARDAQHAIARGASLADIDAMARASLALRSQVGA